MSELVLFETRGAAAILTINRPEKLNALNYALVDRLKERLDAIERDSDIHAVILTGAGDRAFSAGADITEFSETLRRPGRGGAGFRAAGAIDDRAHRVISEARDRCRQRNCLRRRL
jgi:enoyl-CoA hydratase/carnithine racemase